MQIDEELEVTKLELLGLFDSKQNLSIFEKLYFSRFTCFTDCACYSETEQIAFFQQVRFPKEQKCSHDQQEKSWIC